MPHPVAYRCRSCGGTADLLRWTDGRPAHCQRVPEQSAPPAPGSHVSRGSSTQVNPGGHGKPARPPQRCGADLRCCLRFLTPFRCWCLRRLGGGTGTCDHGEPETLKDGEQTTLLGSPCGTGSWQRRRRVSWAAPSRLGSMRAGLDSVSSVTAEPWGPRHA